MNEKRRIVRNEGARETHGEYVIYWMQQSQRVHFNHALNEAVKMANFHQLPLIVFFNLFDQYPDANLRHYQFMLEGLVEVKRILQSFGVNFLFKIGNPIDNLLPYLEKTQALYLDMGYLSHQKMMRDEITKKIQTHYTNIHIEMIDTDLIVPVMHASNKVEYGAYTIRNKIKNQIENFRDFFRIETLNNQKKIPFDSTDDLKDISKTLSRLKIDHSIKPSLIYKGGYIEAMKHFHDFIQHKINFYPMSNDPAQDYTSKLSMYLHFGQISPLEIYERLLQLAIQKKIDGLAFDQFVEQLIIRRELAFNYVFYQKGYDRFETMTEPWAYQSMEQHAHDLRDIIYQTSDYIEQKTHDPYFNAAMKEMVETGYMHNYMRMYWAKKIIEWSLTHHDAYETIKFLNNRYFIDGRDPNSYAGIAWCFGKHDRAWNDRPIFGKLRYMNQAGLLRKFEMDKYVKRIQELTHQT